MRLLLLTICAAGIAWAAPYELHLEFQPDDTLAQLVLRHPLDASDTTNRVRLRDCSIFTPGPDWGVAEATSDDPRLINNPREGGRLIRADYLQDPGDCGLMVYVGAGVATCTLHIVAWPGVPTQSFTRVLSAEEGLWCVTNLPCAQDIGLRVLKAKQVRKGDKWGWFKIKATFDNMSLMNESNTFFVSSVKDERWAYYYERYEVRVNKKGTIGNFGNPKRARVLIKKTNKIIVKGPLRNIIQNQDVAVFVGLNGWSGYEVIPLDEKGKYKASKELRNFIPASGPSLP